MNFSRLASVALALMVAVFPLRAQDSVKAFPSPGRLVDVGGRKLHLYCTGKGTPTVILVAGGDAYSIDWALVQPKIAETTRVCSYDRAGLAWSDSGPADETIEQTVADLHALLRVSREKGPYVLVGASIAGIYIQAYQRAFPAEVAGLVFSNSSNRIGMNAKGKAGLIWELTDDDLRSAFPLPATVKPPEPTHEGEPFDRLPADLQTIRLWLDGKAWQKWDPARVGPESMLSWRKEFLAEFDREDSSAQPPLGSLPVVVIASGPAASEADRHSRSGAGARLDFLSSDTVHIVAQGSGHEIHLYQPDTVIRGVMQILSAIRRHRPLHS